MRYGDFRAAVEQSAAAVELFRKLPPELAHETIVSAAIINLGWSALGLGDHALAADSLREGLSICRRLGHVGRIETCSEGLAAVLIAQGRTQRGAQLLGAAAALRDEHGYGFRDDFQRQVHERVVADAQAALGEATFAAAWARGAAMTPDEVAEFAETE